jgi:hypothetical protein
MRYLYLALEVVAVVVDAVLRNSRRKLSTQLEQPLSWKPMFAEAK